MVNKSRFLVILVYLVSFVCVTGKTYALEQGKKGTDIGYEKLIHFDLSKIEHADPNKDFKKALASNDLRFIAIMGYTIEIPGVDNYHEKYSAYGYKIIEGTSDSIRDEKHGKLIAMARLYAQTYNRLLMFYINNTRNQNNRKN